MNRRKPDGLAARRHGLAEPFDGDGEAEIEGATRNGCFRACERSLGCSDSLNLTQDIDLF